MFSPPSAVPPPGRSSSSGFRMEWMPGRNPWPRCWIRFSPRDTDPSPSRRPRWLHLSGPAPTGIGSIPPPPPAPLPPGLRKPPPHRRFPPGDSPRIPSDRAAAPAPDMPGAFLRPSLLCPAYTWLSLLPVFLSLLIGLQRQFPGKFQPLLLGNPDAALPVQIL